MEEKDLSLFERDGPPAMREQVAVGLQFTAIPEGYETRVMIPLTDDLQVMPDALIFHSPCNYISTRPPPGRAWAAAIVEDASERSLMTRARFRQ